MGLSSSRILKDDNNCLISCYRNFFDIELLGELGVRKLVADSQLTVWLFKKTVVNELMIDNNMANLYYAVLENLEVRLGDTNGG